MPRPITTQPKTLDLSKGPGKPPPVGYAPLHGDYSTQLREYGLQLGAQKSQPWMTRTPVGNCPPGLEYLTKIDQILVKQQVKILEAITDFTCANRYIMTNIAGQQVYFASEESNFCMRQCCEDDRGFVMHISDNMGQEVMRVTREFKCCVGYCWCACYKLCSSDVTVEAPVGEVIGKVRQTYSLLQPLFDITTPDDLVVYRIKGSICVCDGPCCTKDQKFKIFDASEKEHIGTISKQYAGFVNELFTKADNFGVTFLRNLDVKMKATIIGALFLIDFMLFETAL